MTDRPAQDFKRRVLALEALGHRGSATQHEDRAADLLVAELRADGIAAEKERFAGSSSLGGRLAFHVFLSLLCLAAVWLSPWVTAVAGLAVLLCFVAEMGTRVVLLGRLIGRPPSRNVVARLSPDGPVAGRVIVCAHLDTQRAGLIWNDRLTRRMAALYQRLPGPMRSPLFPVMVGLVAVPLVGVMRLAGCATATLALGVTAGVILVVALFLLVEWARGPFVPGAGDNATGSAAALELARRWKASPPPGVELIVLLSGCEESGLLGAAAFLDAHRAELAERPSRFLVLDTLAYGAPRFLDCEHTMATVPRRYPPELVRLCEQVAARLGLTGAGPHSLPTMTDGGAFLARGIPGVALLTWQDGMFMPNYHQLTDTSDRMSFEVGWQATELGWELLRALAEVRDAR